MNDTARSMDEEREYLEELLNTRFNFYLVFSSLLLVAAFGSDSVNEVQRAGALFIGTLVSTLIAISVWRTRLLVEAALTELRASRTHPYAVLFKEVNARRNRFSPLKRSANVYMALVPWLTTVLLALLCVHAIFCVFGRCWGSP